MAGIDKKVIGYFAYFSSGEVICSGATGDACLISGSVGDMKKNIMHFHPDEQRSPTIKKTRFGEIMNGLKLGAAYAFDEKSYKNFYPLARKQGLAVEKPDFEEMKTKGLYFLTVQIEK